MAEWLRVLPDEWVIRWGYSYEDGNETDREGDFLVLGPQGGLLVMEVKSGRLNHLATAGASWTGRGGTGEVGAIPAA